MRERIPVLQDGGVQCLGVRHLGGGRLRAAFLDLHGLHAEKGKGESRG